MAYPKKLHDGAVTIDESTPRVGEGATPKSLWRVYTWQLRPDAADHVDGDLMHWALDSEHPTEEAAQAKADALATSAKATKIKDEAKATKIKDDRKKPKA